MCQQGDVAHPVFWGYQDLTTAANGTPRDVRIYYPCIYGNTAGSPILTMCIVRRPVVLFLHGQPPPGVSRSGYHRKWWVLPHVLARSDYVVMVPNHDDLLPFSDYEPAVAAAMRDVDWVRTPWAEAEWVNKQPSDGARPAPSYATERWRRTWV